MKRMHAVRQLLLFLFCIAVVSSGMYAPGLSAHSGFSCSETDNTLSSAYRRDKIIDTADEIFGTVTGEIKPGIFRSTGKSAPFRTNLSRIMFSMAVLPFIPLIIWTIITVLQRNRFIDRMYLILFIHNSDGKKKDRQALLRHKTK